MEVKLGLIWDAVRMCSALWLVLSVQTGLLVHGQQGDGCGHTILSPTSGTVASRNYPGTYPNHTQCVWNLKVPSEYTLHLIFGDFDLEWSKDCKAGYLTITDKNKAINLGPLCGQLAASDKNILVNSSEVTVLFVSRAHRSGRGFLLSYSTNQHPDLISCLHRGSHFTSQQISGFCPGGCKDVAGEIWGQHGTGYRDTSVLCKAAVHAGVISDSLGGIINVTQQRGITLYESSFANGVLSRTGSLSDKRLVFSRACDGPLVVTTSNASSLLENADRPDRIPENGDSLVRNQLVRWHTSIEDQQPWLELELFNRSTITGIITEGLANSFIETYTIKFSKDRKTWKIYKDTASKEEKVFEASADGHTMALNSLFPQITARYLQIWPQRWYGRVSVQVQVLGCALSGFRPRSIPDGSSVVKPVPRETVVVNEFSTESPVVISPGQSSNYPVLLVVGVVLCVALCVWCLLAGLWWRRRKKGVHMKKCGFDTGCQGGKKLSYTESELVSYPLARSIHDSLPNPPVNVYAEPDVVTGGQKVGVTFRPSLDEGYTVPFSINHYDTPNQLPEYAEPLRLEPEYATPFSEPVADPSLTTQLKTLQNLSHLRTAPSTLQYDCPAHRHLSNGYCTPFINNTASYTQPKPVDLVVQHTYHEPL